MTFISSLSSRFNTLMVSAAPYLKNVTPVQVGTTAVGLVFGLYVVPKVFCCLCCSKKMKGQRVEDKTSHFETNDTTVSEVFESRVVRKREETHYEEPKQYSEDQMSQRTNGNHWVPNRLDVDRVVAVFSDDIVKEYYKEYAWFISSLLNVNESIAKFSKIKTPYFENMFMVNTTRKDSYLLHVVDNKQLFESIHKQTQFDEKYGLGLQLIGLEEAERLLFFKCNEDEAYYYADGMGRLFLTHSGGERPIRPITLDE